MSPIKKVIMFFCGVLFCCGGALAQQQVDTQATNEEFPKMDADKSGHITSEEMQAYQEKRFNEADKDKNGVIDTEELKDDKTGMLAGADKDKDGKVSRQEADSQFKQYVNEMDTDKDGRVSEQEFKEYWPVVTKF